MNQSYVVSLNSDLIYLQDVIEMRQSDKDADQDENHKNHTNETGFSQLSNIPVKDQTKKN